MSEEKKKLTFEERAAIMNNYYSNDFKLREKAITQIVDALDEY